MGQDSSDPQSWNLFSYGLNNPLRYTDPDGHDASDPCAIDPYCVTVTAPMPGLSYFEEFLWRSLTFVSASTMQFAQQGQEVLQTALDWIGKPRDPNCLAGATATGSAIGASVGMVGFAGGPAGGITVPTGFGVGGSAGWAAGMISCMSSTGSGGGGAGGGERRTTPMTNKEAEVAAKKLGYDTKVSDPPFNSPGKAVFTNGRNYITPDRDVHSGGTWKMFDRSGNRLGSYDSQLNRIGP